MLRPRRKCTSELFLLCTCGKHGAAAASHCNPQHGACGRAHSILERPCRYHYQRRIRQSRRNSTRRCNDQRTPADLHRVPEPNFGSWKGCSAAAHVNSVRMSSERQPFRHGLSKGVVAHSRPSSHWHGLQRRRRSSTAPRRSLCCLKDLRSRGSTEAHRQCRDTLRPLRSSRPAWCTLAADEQQSLKGLKQKAVWGLRTAIQLPAPNGWLLPDTRPRSLSRCSDPGADEYQSSVCFTPAASMDLQQVPIAAHSTEHVAGRTAFLSARADVTIEDAHVGCAGTALAAAMTSGPRRTCTEYQNPTSAHGRCAMLSLNSKQSASPWIGSRIGMAPASGL